MPANNNARSCCSGLCVRVACATVVCFVLAALLCFLAGVSWLMFLAPLAIPFGFLVYWALEMAESCMKKTGGGCCDVCKQCFRHCCYTVYSPDITPESICISHLDGTRGQNGRGNTESSNVPVPTYVSHNIDQGTCNTNLIDLRMVPTHLAEFSEALVPFLGHILLPPSYSSLDIRSRSGSLLSGAESLPPPYSYHDPNADHDQMELPPSYSTVDLHDTDTSCV